jgi:hypothetical protein
MSYAVNGFSGVDLFMIIIFIMMLIIGLNRQMIGYIIATAIFLNVKLYPHYFLPIFTYLFIGFLLNMNKDFRDMGWKNENCCQ